MTDSAAILELRHSVLADAATVSPTPLSEEEEGVFVAIDDPPPVRTVLTVVQGQERRPLEVTSVVEVADRDERGTRGFYGRWVDADKLENAAKVGTEHLEDGTPVVQPVVPDHSVSMDVSDAPALGMAAPVMIIEDDTGVVDVSDGDSEDADGEASEASAAETAEGDATEGDTAEGATEGDAAEGAAEGDAVAPEPTAASEPSSDDAAQTSGSKRKGRSKKRGRRRR